MSFTGQMLALQAAHDIQVALDKAHARLAQLEPLVRALENLISECRVQRSAPGDYTWSECLCGEENGHASDCPVEAARAALAATRPSPLPSGA